MKILHFFGLLTILCFVGCGGQTTSSETTDTKSAERTEERVISPNSAKAHFANLGDIRKIGGEKSAEQLAIEEGQKRINDSDNPFIGYWVGAFGKNKINIILSQLNDGKAVGHSVCAGNYRSIEGTYKQVNDTKAVFEMNEPGDDIYDGQFKFTIDLDAEELKGAWTPFQKKGNSSKQYTLQKRSYKYDANLGEYAFASQRLLTTEDVENYVAIDLQLMRNEIYARHGYSFKQKDMRYFFEEKDWYMPMSVDVRDKLTDIEVQNIDLIYEYETYYDEYYDEFGR